MATPKASTSRISIPATPTAAEIEEESINLKTPEAIQALEPEKRVSFYVEAWSEMYETVMAREAFLFSPLEIRAFERWNAMSYEARYLYIRLFIRKNGYFRIARLSYERDIANMTEACRELCSFSSFASESLYTSGNSADDSILIPDSPIPKGKGKAKAALFDRDLSEEIPGLGRFAEDGSALKERADVDELCSMVTLDELKAIAKDFNLPIPKVLKKGKHIAIAWTRPTLIASLKAYTSKQTTLFSSFQASAKDNVKKKKKSKSQPAPTPTKQSDLLIKKLLALLGPVIKLDPSMTTLNNRLHLIFHRCAPPTNHNSMTAPLLARFQKRNYPTYTLSRSFAIFSNREDLIKYEIALRIELDLEEGLDNAHAPVGGPRPSQTMNGEEKDEEVYRAEVAEWKKARSGVKRERYKRILDKFEIAWEAWVICVEEAKKKDGRDKKDDRLSYYLKRFQVGWPLTRAVHKGTEALAYFHMHDREVIVLKALLNQTCFRRGRRGQWWDRLALIYMEHGMAGVTEETRLGSSSGAEDDDIMEITNTRLSQEECRREALAICWKGLEDPWTHLVERHALQRRIARLESLLKVPKEKRHVFAEQLNKAVDVELQGDQLGDRVTGKKSIWKSTLDPEEVVSVEELSLQHYRAAGWTGVHSENSILTTIFSLLFWDILFYNTDGAFETAYQSEPLDLRTDAFSIVRADLVATRLQEIAAGKTLDILAAVDDRERPRATWCVGVRWETYSKEDLVDIVQCIGDNALATICRVYAEDYEHRVGGVPDLFLWKPDRKRAKFVEVKGPGDILSKTQKVWIDVLLSAGLKVEKCNVKAIAHKKRSRSASRAAQASDDEEEEEEEEAEPVSRKKPSRRKTA